MEEPPGKLIPRASTADDMVFAVYIPPHEPARGRARFSSSVSSSSVILPALHLPTASKTLTLSTSCPRQVPGRMLPPYTNKAGISRRASAIKQPGIFLSHPPMATTPSKRCALLTNSIESAITSRLGRENFMPSVPMDMPSLTVMVPKIWGTPPPTRTPSLTFSAKRLICELHGVISLHVLATPISGLLKSSSVKPTARNMERLGARISPSVMVRLRLLREVVFSLSDILVTYPFSCVLLLSLNETGVIRGMVLTTCKTTLTCTSILAWIQYMCIVRTSLPPCRPPAQGTHKGCPICINLTLDSRIAKGLQPFDGVWGVPKNLFSSPPQAARGVKGRAWGHPEPRQGTAVPWTPGLG